MSKIEVLTGLVSLDPSLLGCQVAVFLLCPHVVSFLSVCIPGVSFICPSFLFL